MIEQNYIRLRNAAKEVSETLRTYGFPVSEAAEPALRNGGSRESNRMHDAAVKLQDALATTWDPSK